MDGLDGHHHTCRAEAGQCVAAGLLSHLRATRGLGRSFGLKGHHHTCRAGAGQCFAAGLLSH